ncbi:DUF3040 domain-containing protein [Streptomyces bambusae]|uniref:DUF3040 domain-containing protein n=1 Tax=Streptomyces bambusae TaxID=1550616 RepID=A0ABS6Z240_9ACTN|nr:DUF3040 domain-containing protein [Streptomyces bambusae]MBW5481464.1 DUF3040 domain-containing protein [Streptomyces bambusae]
MDGRGLSEHEQKILGEIERTLASDALLARRLTTMRRGVRPWTGPVATVREHVLAVAAWLAGLAALVLFVPAVSRSSPTLIWAFAGAWVLTLVCVLRLVCRWCRRCAERRPTGGARAAE